MPKRLVRLFALLMTIGVLAGSTESVVARQPTGSFDTIRIVGESGALPYQVWVAWSPLIIPTNDGGAWVFFSAQTRDGETLGTRRLYASRFDPASATWTPATAMPGGEVQFGPSAVVDGEGRVHVVYSDRTTDTEDVFGVLMYTVSDGNGGWAEPTPIAPNENAGHQLSPSLAIDGAGRLHVAWQDQRLATAEDRVASPANADIFVSDRNDDGTWTEAVQSNDRPGPEVNASRPHLAVDGNRLVSIWSIYEVATGLETATRVEWSTRPIDDPAAWADPQPLIEREGEILIGGRLLDVSGNPAGGLNMVWGRHVEDQSELFLRRLPAGSNEWEADIPLGTGAGTSFPTMDVGPDGTSYMVYNVGSSGAVQVGSMAVAPDATAPGPETVLTQGEDGSQGRAVVRIAADGVGWLVYFHEPGNGVAANAVRVQRRISIPPA